MARLEHVNLTVRDPRKTAQMLQDVFGWTIRWEGAALNGQGYTVHVGGKDDYLAIYSGPNPDQTVPKAGDSYRTRGGLNHIGIVVNDLDAALAKVAAMGFATHSHADYEPGRRFYFHDADGVEFEVVSYAAA